MGGATRAAWLAGHALRLLLAAVFLSAAVLKAMDPEGFAAEVVQYGILSGMTAKIFAYAMLPIEMVVGLALLLNYRSVASLSAACVLLLVFITALSYAIWTDQPLRSCGCFGRNTPRTPQQTLREDLILLGAGVAGACCLSYGRRRVRPPQAGPQTQGRWRPALLASSALMTGAFVIAAPGLPLDNMATALAPGVRWESLAVALAEVDLGKGAHFVALMGLKDEATLRALPGINALAASGSVPVVGLYGDDDAAYTEFYWTKGPAFPLYHVSPDDISRLHRRLPRFFVVKDGTVAATWATLPPASVVAPILGPSHGEPAGNS